MATFKSNIAASVEDKLSLSDALIYLLALIKVETAMAKEEHEGHEASYDDAPTNHGHFIVEAFLQGVDAGYVRWSIFNALARVEHS